MTTVKNHGAVGDGIKDDTIAFQKAIDSGDSEVYVPPGRYKLTSSVKLRSNLVLRIHGEVFRPDGFTAKGWDSTFFILRHNRGSNPDGTPFIKYGNVTILGDGVGVLNVNGRKALPTWRKEGATLGGVLIENAENVTAEGFTIKDTGIVTYKLICCKNAWISRLIIDANRGANEGDDQNNSEDGIHLSDCHNVYVDQNTIDTMDDCVAVETGYSNKTGTSRNIFITNNILTHSYPGPFTAWPRAIYAYSTDGRATEIHASGNVCSSDGYGIYSENCSLVRLNNNTITKAGRFYPSFRIVKASSEGMALMFHAEQPHGLKFKDKFIVAGCGGNYDSRLNPFNPGMPLSPYSAAPASPTVIAVESNHPFVPISDTPNGTARRVLWFDGIGIKKCKQAFVSHCIVQWATRDGIAITECEKHDVHSCTGSTRIT